MAKEGILTMLVVVARCVACGFESWINRKDNEECPRCLRSAGWVSTEEYDV